MPRSNLSSALGVAVPTVNILMSVLPLYVVNGSCYVTTMTYCIGDSGAPTYISVFESLLVHYIPLFILSVLVLTVYTSMLLGFVKREPVALTLVIAALVLSSISFSYFCSQLPSKLILRSTIGQHVEVHAELLIEKTPLGHYASNWGPLIAALALLAVELATRPRSRTA